MRTLEFSGCTFEDDAAALAADALRASDLESLSIAGSPDLVQAFAHGLPARLAEFTLRSDGVTAEIHAGLLATILEQRPTNLQVFSLQGMELVAEPAQSLAHLGAVIASHPTLRAVRMDGSIAICNAAQHRDFDAAIRENPSITEFTSPRRCAMSPDHLVKWMLEPQDATSAQ